MQTIKQHRKMANGSIMGFIQTIRRDRSGRFAKQIFPTSANKIISLILGVLFILFLIAISYSAGVLYGKTLSVVPAVTWGQCRQ